MNNPTPLGAEIDRLRLALAAASELKRRAEQPECEPDFQRMPTYVKRLHTALFDALEPVPATETLPGALVPHACPIEGAMHIEAGQPCNWCGHIEEEATT